MWEILPGTASVFGARSGTLQVWTTSVDSRSSSISVWAGITSLQ